MLALALHGQLPSGKNQIKTRMMNGRLIRYPNRVFKAWREDAAYQLIEQIGGRRRELGLPLLAKPLVLFVSYTPGDLITRDVPGLEDALFHLLTYCNLIKDDGQIRHVNWHECPLNREAPGVRFTIGEM